MIIKLLILKMFIYGAGRGGRTPMTLRSADFESAASASSAIPALHCNYSRINDLIDVYRTVAVVSKAPVALVVAPVS